MFLNKIIYNSYLVPFRNSRQIKEIFSLQNKCLSRNIYLSSYQGVKLFIGNFNNCGCNANRNKILTNFHIYKINYIEFPKYFSSEGIENPNKENANRSAVSRPPKKTLYQRLKQMFRDYWYVLVPVHVATSICWFGGFYYLAKSGINIIYFLEYFNVSETLINPLRDSSAGFVAISYALYKIFTPLRYTVTLGGTTVLINYLKNVGYIKPIPPKAKLRELIQENKEHFLEKKEQIFDSVRERRHNFKETKDNIMRTMKEKKDYIKNKKNFE